MRPVLLIDIGAGPLPATTPPASVSASWVPDVYVPPPLPAPTNLVIVAIADAAQLTWTRSTAVGAETIVEIAPNVAGAPGAWIDHARMTTDHRTVALPTGPRWVRLKAFLNGRKSVATAAALASPVVVADIQADANAAAAAALAAQNAANAAQADATSSLAQLSDISSDARLTAGEKVQAKREYEEVTAEQAGIDAQATAYAITTEKTAYDNAISSLKDYLRITVLVVNSSYVWTNVTGTMSINRVTWNTNWNNVYSKRQALLNKIVEKAKALADAAQGGADSAATAAAAAHGAANAAQADANAALSDLANIASDGVLSSSEKPRVIQDRDELVNEQAGIEAQAAAYGITTARTAYVAAITAMTSYLAGLTSPTTWNNLAGNTTIVGVTFRQKFVDAYLARQQLLNEIYAQAKALVDARAKIVDLPDSADNLFKRSTFNDGLLGQWAGPNASHTTSNHTQLLDAIAITGNVIGADADKFAVKPGDVFELSGDFYVSPMVVGSATALALRFSDRAGLTVGYVRAFTWTKASGNAGWVYGVTTDNGQGKGRVIAPAGAVFAAPTLYLDNPAGGNVQWTRMRCIKTADTIPDGNTTGLYALDDGYISGGKRRFGLRIAGSGHRIGNQHNLPQSIVNAYGSVRTATALSATSAGAVSINAHTTREGGASTTYNAVSNAVTGLTPGVSYVIYCFDDAHAGGTRTWYAGTNPAAVMALGDGLVVAGQITIPTSGSSSGGGGSGGTDPSDWCVDFELARLPDGRYARDLVVGDLAPCWNMDSDAPAIEQHPMRAIALGWEQSYLLVTEAGAAVPQSGSTPMVLRDGTTRRTTEMVGELVLVNRSGRQVWERTAALIDIGLRLVVKLDFGDRVFYAGLDPTVTIATHNATLKP